MSRTFACVLIVVAFSAHWSVQESRAQKIVLDNERLNTVKFIDNKRIPALEAGQLIRLKVREGSQVDIGDIIGYIDSEVSLLELARAQAAYEKAMHDATNTTNEEFAKESIDTAENELQRSKDARDIFEKSVSESELERLRLTVTRGELSLKQAKFERTSAALAAYQSDKDVKYFQNQIQRRVIVSRAKGEVVEVFKRAGEWLERGEPVVRIVDKDILRVEALVDGTKYSADDLYRRPINLTAKVPSSPEPQIFNGYVAFVSPELQPVSKKMRILINVKNSMRHLRDGDSGVIEIDLGAPRVPEEEMRAPEDDAAPAATDSTD